MIAYYLFRKRRFADIIPVFAIGIMILTCIASPVNDCFRYYAPVAAAFPALFALFGKKSNVLWQIRDDKLAIKG